MVMCLLLLFLFFVMEISYSSNDKQIKTNFRKLDKDVSLLSPTKNRLMKENEEKQNGAKCPKNHGLKRFQTSHGNYRCDECGKKFRRGTTMNGCIECNFDLCIDCSDFMETKCENDEVLSSKTKTKSKKFKFQTTYKQWKNAEYFFFEENEKTKKENKKGKDLTITHENMFASRLIKATEEKEEKERKWANADEFDVKNHSIRNEEKQKLKEYFVGDFNAFIDNASSLEYLEIEIPEKTLDYISISSPYLIIHRPNDFHLCVSGYNTNEPNGPFLKEKFQVNDNESCELMKSCVSETEWQKIFKLNGNDTFKFKFYFRQCGYHHRVILGGQTFSFVFFALQLRKPSGKIFVCQSVAEFDASPGRVKTKYLIPPYVSTPKERVKILENIGVEFNFKFYPSNDKPLKSFYPNYFQNNENNFDNESYPNFQNNPYYTGEKYDMSQNFDFQEHFHHADEEYQNFDLDQECFLEEYDGFEQNSFFREIYNIYYTNEEYSQNFNFQNDVFSTFEKFQNFDLDQKSYFDEYGGFEKDSFFQEIQNFNFQKYCHYTREEYQNFDLDQKDFSGEYDDFEQDSFFRDNLFDEDNSIVKFSEDTDPVIFAKKPSPCILFEDNSRTENLKQANLSLLGLTSSVFEQKYN